MANSRGSVCSFLILLLNSSFFCILRNWQWGFVLAVTLGKADWVASARSGAVWALSRAWGLARSLAYHSPLLPSPNLRSTGSGILLAPSILFLLWNFEESARCYLGKFSVHMKAGSCWKRMPRNSWLSNVVALTSSLLCLRARRLQMILDLKTTSTGLPFQQSPKHFYRKGGAAKLMAGSSHHSCLVHVRSLCFFTPVWISVVSHLRFILDARWWTGGLISK